METMHLALVPSAVMYAHLLPIYYNRATFPVLEHEHTGYRTSVCNTHLIPNCRVVPTLSRSS